MYLTGPISASRVFNFEFKEPFSKLKARDSSSNFSKVGNIFSSIFILYPSNLDCISDLDLDEGAGHEHAA